jgi:hypothetical protein
MQGNINVPIRSGGNLEDARLQFLPSVFPSIAAAIFVLLLIGTLALVCVGGVALIGPMFSQGDNAAHADGKIVSIGPGRNFVLDTASGQRLAFQCMEQCRASLWHMQRHLREQAHTDVYYILGPNKSLMALDVD